MTDPTDPTDTENLLAVMTYHPFPNGTTPDGWPDEYVSSTDFLAVCAKVRELQGERNSLALAFSSWRRDMEDAGKLCGQTDDECPLAAAQRVVAERDAAMAQVRELRGERDRTQVALDETAKERDAIWNIVTDTLRELPVGTLRTNDAESIPGRVAELVTRYADTDRLEAERDAALASDDQHVRDLEACYGVQKRLTAERDAALAQVDRMREALCMCQDHFEHTGFITISETIDAALAASKGTT